MVNYKYIKIGHTLKIAVAVGTLLVFLVFIGGAGALSDTTVSDNIWDNYPDIASSKDNLPDYPPGRPLHTLHTQQFPNSIGTDNMPVQTAATGITKVGHFGGMTDAVEGLVNYVYTGQGK